MVKIAGSSKIMVGIEQTVLDDPSTFTCTINTWTDVPGFSVALTPQDSTNKVLITWVLWMHTSTSASVAFRLVRGSTTVGVGIPTGSRIGFSTRANTTSDANVSVSNSFEFLDAPATSSSVTYKVQYISQATNIYLNRTQNYADSIAIYNGVPISTLTAKEITGY